MADSTAAESAEDPSGLENPLDVISNSVVSDASSSIETATKSELGEEEEPWEEKRQRLPKVVDVKELDFEHFKNRYSPTEGLEIIEVLIGHPHIHKEVYHETLRRKRGKKWDFKYEKTSVGDEERKWIQRVRIQSPPILLLLSRLTGHGDDWSVDKPRVFFQPFRTFYYYFPQIKECLKILEQRWAKIDAQGGGEQANEPNTEPKAEAMPSKPREELEDDNSSDSDSDENSEADTTTSPMDPKEAVVGQIANSVTAFKHVKRFAGFVEKEIMPLWERALGTSQRNFRCANLWMAFQSGELLYIPPPSDSLQGSGKGIAPASKVTQNVWRFYTLTVDRIKDDCPDDTNANPERELELHCYSMDYSGSSYGPVKQKFTIRSYEGEKDITTLPIYPMRYLKDSQEMVTKLHAQGKQFQSIIKEPHLYYDGWTLTCDPPEKSESKQPMPSEYIDSDVIVDFAEGYKSNSALNAPTIGDSGNFEDRNWPSGADELHIIHWADESRSELLEEIEEITQTSELFGGYLKRRHFKNFGLSDDWRAGKISQVEEKDICLLPRHAIAYALRQRKFIIVDINTLQKVPAPQNAFKDLKIDKNHKRLVESLVKTHFRTQSIRKRQLRARLNQDLIRGKGSGLVILLHGVPGVGKTATAEAVSAANRKPLFTITCGDLGFTPKEVEESLMEIFRLAHTWDCVLLLDEADVFLARREVSDLNRNALVSVFLRVLEYYSGVLFLTTNRVGTLDEAFKSRIHISLYYPPLGRKQTLAIFEVNIRKLIDIEKEKQEFQHDEDTKNSKRPTLNIDRESILAFAAWYFDHHGPSERWNGRQIRNAFQIAYSLAQYDMQDASMNHLDEDYAEASVKGENTSDGLQTSFTLNHEQFSDVADAIEKFDAYLHEAIGSDTENSHILGLRNDHHKPSQQSNRFFYYPSPPQARRPKYSTTRDGSQQRPDQVHHERREDYDPTGNGYKNSAPPRQRYNDGGPSQGYSQQPSSMAYRPSQQYSPPGNHERKPQGAPQQGKTQYLNQHTMSQMHTQRESPMRQHDSDDFSIDNEDYDNNKYNYKQGYDDNEENYSD